MVRVIKPIDIAARVFARDGQLRPRFFVKESDDWESCFAARRYKTTDLLLTSTPPGATVRRDGVFAGNTPFLIRGAPVGGRLELTVSLDGYEKVNPSRFSLRVDSQKKRGYSTQLKLLLKS